MSVRSVHVRLVRILLPNADNLGAEHAGERVPRDLVDLGSGRELLALGYLVDEASAVAAVRLHVLAVVRPVEVSDEARVAAARADLLVGGRRGEHVHVVLVGADSQILAAWRVLHFVKHLTATLLLEYHAHVAICSSIFSRIIS